MLGFLGGERAAVAANSGRFEIRKLLFADDTALYC